MKLGFFFLVCLTALGWTGLAADQPDPLEFDIELKREGEEIDRLQEQLHQRTTEYNEKLSKKASGKTSSGNEAYQPQKSLEQRVAALEQEMYNLKNNHKKVRHPTQAELDAIKKAEANAPILAVNSPAIAQYNQALSLLKNNELEKAKEAFLKIINDYPQDIYAAKSYVHLGEVNLQLRNFSAAANAFNEALTSQIQLPLMTVARLGLAEALIHLDKQEECCHQLKILEKEVLADDQKKRVKTLLEKTNCHNIGQKKKD